MFDSLKKKLQNIRTKFASNIEEAATVQPAVEQPAPPPTVEPAPPPVITPAPPLPGKSLAPPAAREEKREDPTFFNRLKILVREREILLQEKDIEEPLMELEMVLRESDVVFEEDHLELHQRLLDILLLEEDLPLPDEDL